MEGERPLIAMLVITKGYLCRSIVKVEEGFFPSFVFLTFGILMRFMSMYGNCSMWFAVLHCGMPRKVRSHNFHKVKQTASYR